MVMHQNANGYWEDLDPNTLPLRDCGCQICLAAARDFPEDNGSVSGQSAYIKQSGDRTEAYHGQFHQGKVVSNDGINASFVRDENGNVVADDSKDDPYDPYLWMRR